MNKTFKILLIFLFISNCSLQSNSKFWSKQKIQKEKIKDIKQIFKKKEKLHQEFNPSLKIKIYSKMRNNSSSIEFDNNQGRINYNGKLKNISKYKFKKIKNFYQYEPEISFNQNNVIFFDNKGSILNFDSESNLIWKKNYYTKTEKKQNPILFFANNEKYLIIADNIAKFYVLNINTGELLWSKKNNAPFNSQIKIYKDKFYLVDFENTLRAYSLKNGEELWNIKTQNSRIRSQKKLSLVIIDEKIYFNNSLGDISAVHIDSGELIWQTPTQNSLAFDTGFFLETSVIVANSGSIYFSNNQNQFFSLDAQTGSLNWKQDINSNLRPTIINDYIFTVSLEGYLIILEKISGKIIRANDIFNVFKAKKRSKIKPTGFVVGVEDVYLSLDNGRLLIIDVTSGQTKSIIKINSKKISKPVIVNKNLYIIADNSIVRLN